MSRGPEANLWASLRQNLPATAFSTRIENTHGGGVPDVYILWDSLPFWLELKVCKVNSVNIRPHQIAWNMAHYARGGLSFFLVKVLSTGELCLFTADQGPKVASGGCSAVRGSRFESMGALVVGLGELVEAHYGRVLRPSAR